MRARPTALLKWAGARRARAAEVGFLDEAVEESALLESAIALAEQVAALDMEAHRNTKGRARVPLNAALKQALEQELAS